MRPLSMVLIAAVAATLLLWNLGAVALWQDEAATAVLARRMLRFGRPLGYDGRNLITMDRAAPEDAAGLDQRTASAQAAVRYYVARGDFRADTTWTGQPWGQFVAAGLSLAALGQTTLAARLPFAVAGILTVVLLAWLVRRHLDERTAVLAAFLLLANVFWLLHTRQSRYYALSSLMLLATLAAWARWQAGARHGAAAFVATAWGLFQVDYGTFWPAAGVMLAEAARASWPRLRGLAATTLALLAAVAPFALYYQLGQRLHSPAQPAAVRLLGTLFNVNHFVVPLLVLAAAASPWGCRHLDPLGRRLVHVCAALVLMMVLWVPAVAPRSFHRYVVQLTPLGALLGAVVVRRLTQALAPVWSAVAAGAAAALLALTPLAAATVSWCIPPPLRSFSDKPLWRGELALLGPHLFSPPEDPTRRLVEWLGPRLSEADEILVTYEDIPLMFSTPARVRGGIPAFRVEDPAAAPRFAILRRVPFVPWAPFERELGRHCWRRAEVDLPNVAFWANPDPLVQQLLPRVMPPVTVLERLGPAADPRCRTSGSDVPAVLPVPAPL